MKMFKNALIAITLVTLLSTKAYADMCDGPVNSVAVQNNGQLFIRHAGGGHWLLCSVVSDNVFGGVLYQP
jgi:hypothetical protein